MIELTVAWQQEISQEGEPDPLRSEYGNLCGFCNDPRLGHRIVVVKKFSPWTGSELPQHDSFVFRAVPNLDGDGLIGNQLSINGDKLPGTRVLIASNQNPFHPWASVQPDDDGNIPTVDLYFAGREWVDQISDQLGVPRRGDD